MDTSKVKLVTVDSSMRQQIADSIKQYLLQFDNYSKAITDIQKLCDIPQRELEMLPARLQELKRKQRAQSEALLGLNARFKDLINQDRQNQKKIERAFQEINTMKLALLETDEMIRKLNEKRNSARACSDTAPEVKATLAAQFKIVLDKLVDARKHFPDIYAEVERETGIHFFVPIS
ncbi:MAG: hypothetical protein GYA24_04690 [Candidatus Lokiarchaeota archaeon]|nr:hypothetical protein [Candidatus Lokiarchaeota archaeon]